MKWVSLILLFFGLLEIKKKWMNKNNAHFERKIKKKQINEI